VEILSKDNAPAIFAKETAAKKQKIGNKALEAAMRRLMERGILESVQEGPPSRIRHELRRCRPPSTSPTEVD
jgi:hypothetical protein